VCVCIVKCVCALTIVCARTCVCEKEREDRRDRGRVCARKRERTGETEGECEILPLANAIINMCADY